jgi:hypothetical protein
MARSIYCAQQIENMKSDLELMNMNSNENTKSGNRWTKYREQLEMTKLALQTLKIGLLVIRVLIKNLK